MLTAALGLYKDCRRFCAVNLQQNQWNFSFCSTSKTNRAAPPQYLGIPGTATHGNVQRQDHRRNRIPHMLPVLKFSAATGATRMTATAQPYPVPVMPFSETNRPEKKITQVEKGSQAQAGVPVNNLYNPAKPKQSYFPDNNGKHLS